MTTRWMFSLGIGLVTGVQFLPAMLFTRLKNRGAAESQRFASWIKRLAHNARSS